MTDEQIPWGLSDMKPNKLTTLKDMTPEQKEIAIRGNEAWIRLGLATRDHCSRCRYYYDEPSPNCPNILEHTAVSELAEGLQAREEAVMADIEKGSSKVVEDVLAGLGAKLERKLAEVNGRG